MDNLASKPGLFAQSTDGGRLLWTYYVELKILVSAMQFRPSALVVILLFTTSQPTRSVTRDIETPTLRLRTIERDIRAGKVILIIGIQHGGDRKRAGPRLRGGPYHCDHEILSRARPRERPSIVVPGIGECALPGPR
jgi:hypothetical protein